MTLQDQYQELIDAGYSPEEARAYVTPATDTSSLGNFIGDPNHPETNQFQPASSPNGISSYSPAKSVPPWMIQQAGRANELPGMNPQASLDFQDAYGVDPRKLDEERKVAIAAVKGAEGNVPQKDIDSLDSGYKDAISRLGPILQSGVSSQEAIDSLFSPLRNEAKSLVLEHRYKTTSINDPQERLLAQEVAIESKGEKSAAKELATKQNGVDYITPPTTNITSSWFGLGTPSTNITPAGIQHTNPFPQGQIDQSMAKYKAAKAAKEAALKDYADYLARMGKPLFAGRTFEMQSGAGTNSPLKVGRFTVIPQ